MSLDPGGMERAAKIFRDRFEDHLVDGLDLSLQRIAAEAKLTTRFTDRTGALRASIQSDGVSLVGSDIVGVVSFAARSSRGYLYGLVQEYGRKDGSMQGKFFIRDAVQKEMGAAGIVTRALERALSQTLREAGFEVEAAE